METVNQSKRTVTATFSNGVVKTRNTTLNLTHGWAIHFTGESASTDRYGIASSKEKAERAAIAEINWCSKPYSRDPKVIESCLQFRKLATLEIIELVVA